MKRLTASRALKRPCFLCNRKFSKGDVYYKHREVHTLEDGRFWGMESLICPRCKHKGESQDKRFNEFKKRCVHPKRFIHTEYQYVPGECIQEPAYDMCHLCGQII